MKDDKLCCSRPKSAQAPRKCPKCGKNYCGYPALSREDNKTEICPECGVVEALRVFGNNISNHPRFLTCSSRAYCNKPEQVKR